MKCLANCLILLLATLDAIGLQQTKTNVDANGNRSVMDGTTGWTVTEKNGKVTHWSAVEVTKFCSDLENLPFLADGKDGVGAKEICEEWGEVQPRTQIEQVPFARMIVRLLMLTPSSTNFERYRGMELKSDAKSKLYDATIVPNDLGNQVSCTVLESQIALKEMLYKFGCSIKTSSYPEAIAMEERLVSLLKSLNLDEDQVKEHGLTVSAQNDGRCAPTGDCEDDHVYVTSLKDWKRLVIEGEPVFTRINGAETFALTGHDGMIVGIAPDSGTVTFAVYSWGSSGPEQPVSKSDGK